MMKRTLFICAYLSVIIIACKQSGKKATQRTHIDSFTRNMNHRVEGYAARGLWDSANYYVNQLADTVQGLNNSRLTFYWKLAKVQLLLADYRFDSATIYLNQASTLLGSNNVNKYKDSFSLYVIHEHLLIARKLYDSALRIGTEVYYLAKRNDSALVSRVCYELAKIYIGLGDLSNMRKYTMEAWNYKDKDPELINSIAQLVMVYYDNVGRVDSAIYYLRILQNTQGIYSNQQNARAALYENTGLLLIKRGKLQEGLLNILKAKSILDSLKIKSAAFYNNLADTYSIMEEYGKAFIYIDSAILIAKEDRDYNTLSLAWRTKSELYFKRLRYREAYGALDSSYSYSTEEADSSLRKHARELETKYAVREKDNTINSLALTNQANLRIRNQQRVIIIVISIAIFLLASVVWLLWRRRHLRTKLREASLQQQLLRTQMQPHFIYNALSVLLGFIRSQDIKKAVKYVTQFGRLLRLSLENASESFVLLKKEIEALESYLSLQAIRLEGRFDWKIEVMEEYLKESIFIPPMILQPFVENAIVHGISQISEKGLIHVTIQKNEHTLYCRIADNGVGMRESLTDPAGRSSVSTLITRERLAILGRHTGHPASLTISDSNGEYDHGVVVSLVIPFIGAVDKKERYGILKSPRQRIV